MAVTTPDKPKLGRPVDTEARELALQLRAEIEAAGYTIAEVARFAGLTDNSSYTGVAAALRGDRTNRPGIAKMRTAFDRMRGATS